MHGTGGRLAALRRGGAARGHEERAAPVQMRGRRRRKAEGKQSGERHGGTHRAATRGGEQIRFGLRRHDARASRRRASTPGRDPSPRTRLHVRIVMRTRSALDEPQRCGLPADLGRERRRLMRPANAGRRMASPREAEETLRQLLLNGGYVRVADLAKRSAHGSASYKKGYEARFVVATRQELESVRRLLKAAGFRAGKPFAKHTKLVQPVYGRDAVERLRGR